MSPVRVGGGLTWAQLRDIRCAELEGAADGWGNASNRADAARDRVDKQLLAGLTAAQEGRRRGRRSGGCGRWGGTCRTSTRSAGWSVRR